MSDLKGLMRQFDMGLAYRQITATMGPDAQLLAFIRYDTVSDTSLGLESWNILEQHDAVLDQITSIEQVALEGLGNFVKKYRKWLIDGGILSLLDNVGWDLGLDAITSGSIKVKENTTKVPIIGDFKTLTTAFNVLLAQETSFTTSMPAGRNDAQWGKFYADVIGQAVDVSEDVKALLNRTNIKGVDFATSGWTADNYKNAVQWLIVNIKKADAASKAQAAKLQEVETMLSNGKPMDKSVSYMHRAVEALDETTHHTVDILEKVASLLKKISRNFESTKK